MPFSSSAHPSLDKTLAHNEVILCTIEPHWVNNIQPIFHIGGALLLGGLTAVAHLNQYALASYVLFAAMWLTAARGLFFMLQLQNLEQTLTNHRLVKKTGIYARHTEELRLSAVETVEIRQTIIQRMLNAGTIHITGKGVSTLNFPKIQDPLAVKQAIENALNP